MSVPMVGFNNFNYNVVPMDYPSFDTNGDFGQQMYAMGSAPVSVPMTPATNQYMTTPNYNYGYNTASVFATQKDYQQQQDKYNAPYLAQQDKYSQIVNAIAADDQEAIYSRYSEALTLIKNANPSMTDAEARAQLKRDFAACTGVDLIEAIRANGLNDAQNIEKNYSLKTIIKGDAQVSADETIRKIEGTQKTQRQINEEQNKVAAQKVGNVAKYAGAGAVAGGVGVALLASNPVGWAIAGVGAAIYGIGSLIKKFW